MMGRRDDSPELGVRRQLDNIGGDRVAQRRRKSIFEEFEWATCYSLIA